MASFCFTGRGLRISGEHYTRENWQALAHQFGHQVHDKVDWMTEYLVAARTDTSKASKARDLNTHVITYADFERWMLLGQTPGAQPRTASAFERQGLASDIAQVAAYGTTSRTQAESMARRYTRAEHRLAHASGITPDEARRAFTNTPPEPEPTDALAAEGAKRAIQWDD